MDLKTITTTLALLGCGANHGCDGGASTAEKAEVKPTTEVVKTEVTKTEVTKTEVKTDAKEVTPAAADTKADAKGEMKCAEGKCGEGACGGKKTEGEEKAVPVDAGKVEAGKTAVKAEKPTDKT